MGWTVYLLTFTIQINYSCRYINIPYMVWDVYIHFGVLILLSRWWFQKILIFITYLRKWSNLTNIFRTGWNHQLGMVVFTPLRFFFAILRQPFATTPWVEALWWVRGWLMELEPEGDLKLGQSGHSMRPIYSLGMKQEANLWYFYTVICPKKKYIVWVGNLRT